MNLKRGRRPTRPRTQIEPSTLNPQPSTLNPQPSTLKQLKKRKMVAAANYKTYKVEKGESYAPTRTKAAADITMEMMQVRPLPY